MNKTEQSVRIIVLLMLILICLVILGTIFYSVIKPLTKPKKEKVENNS